MRPTIVAATLLLTLVAGCTKRTSSPVIGQWELRSWSNGQGQMTGFPPGNGHVIEFSGTLYKGYESGQLLHSYSYSLKKDTSRTGREVFRLLLDNQEDDVIPFAIEVFGRQLVLFADAFDGPATTYERIGQ